MPASDLARKTAELASHDIGIREVGENDGPRIREYQETVGLGPGDPYCAAAVSTWVDEAQKEAGILAKLHYSGSALHLLHRNGALAFEPSSLTADDIPCIFVIDHGLGHGHAGLIVGLDYDNPGMCQTIEANTNPAGSREGDGVYARTRNVAELAGCIRIA